MQGLSDTGNATCDSGSRFHMPCAAAVKRGTELGKWLFLVLTVHLHPSFIVYLTWHVCSPLLTARLGAITLGLGLAGWRVDEHCGGGWKDVFEPSALSHHSVTMVQVTRSESVATLSQTFSSSTPAETPSDHRLLALSFDNFQRLFKRNPLLVIHHHRCRCQKHMAPRTRQDN